MADNLPPVACDLCDGAARFLLIDLFGSSLALCTTCVRLVQSWRSSSTLN